MNLKKDKNRRTLTLVIVSTIVVILFFTGFSIGKEMTNIKIGKLYIIIWIQLWNILKKTTKLLFQMHYLKQDYQVIKKKEFIN